MLREIFCTILWIWYVALWCIGLIGWRTARKQYSNRPRSPLSSSPADAVPGVSILRPLKGLDTNLFENLESSMVQEYPKYEVIFAVENESDQALGVVRDVIAKHPHVDARVKIGYDAVGVNPKVNNLIRPYREAKHDILWVIDSNVQVASGAMGRAVDALCKNNHKPNAKRIGLVHHVPFAWASERPWGSQIEEAFLNTNHAKMYIALNVLAVDSCVIGKSCMYRRSDVEQLTGTLKPASKLKDPNMKRGLEAFGRFLAEDNMIGAAIWHELGMRHDMSCDVAKNAIGNMDLAAYFWRRVRWVRVRKHMVLSATIIEPFTESVLLGTLMAWSLRSMLGFPMVVVLICHTLVWLLVDLDVYAALAGHAVPASIRLTFIRAWFFRELLALPIFLYAVFGNEVTWRGRTYRVLSNSEAQRVERPLKWWGRERRSDESAGQTIQPLMDDVS
ncbi:glycosyltransferase family 21 protein [Dacryopinax primogenitus]|uniref:Ceramide glucosyltransferase n=1 Tax=Dacryopinax primogenitus (strain DJM 731) TaxID=1858805 RepID=M5GEV3_DACPD|nr:glycosyltransferase family 21 protein [Dacryopinax primogenitus]EJU05712.1 glycosyltransferase family 21 protein [Dacryopinax primogenitus]